jgi:NAD(P)-dependent dehydrogenase (short-subunit alcohol dehydrogenase family)
MQALRPLHDQVVVVAGASSGICREAALRFGEAGSRVALAARDEAGLRDVAEAIRRRGGEALVVPTDVTRVEDLDELAERTAREFGGIDTWINGAAVTSYATVEQLTLDEFRRVFEVDFFGQVYGCRAALPYLEERGAGVLICIGSVLSDRAVPLQSAYSAAKHALKAFTESLRVELEHAGSGVQVTLVKPSSINTPLFDHALTKTGMKPKPVPPVYEASIVAGALLYCATHREREVTIGGAGKMLTSMENAAGGLMDRVLKQSGFSMQETDEPKSEDAPNNLYGPLHELNRIEGSFPGRSFSLYTWLRTHPRVAFALAGAFALALATTRAGRDDPGD